MAKRILSVLALVVGAVWMSAGWAVAEDANIEYTGGLVISTTDKSVVISDYDYDKDEEVEMEYVLGPDSKIVNAAGLGEVAKGSWVEISYKAEGDKRVVTELLLEVAEPEAAVETS